MNYDSDYIITAFAFGICVGLVIASIVIVAENRNTLKISEDTATDICKNLVHNNTVVPSVDDGKLICTIPSYDDTTNIIVRKAN